MKKIAIIMFALITSIPGLANSQTVADNCNLKKYKNSEIVVGVTAGRDIGPVTRMDGSGLIISVDVVTRDRKPLPKTLTISKAIALTNLGEWDMNRSNDISITRYFDGTGFSFIFREGPLWPVDSSINIHLGLKIDDFACEYSQRTIQIRKNN